ncbi:MAG: hypothetical protein HY512_03515 [Candidatus Aenigmarchaeota archaeon]|nr:hypothetical protein [Candidatus Aenigmarchaeota archaeon]
MVEFGIDLENEFDIAIPERDMQDLKTVQDAVDYIKRRTGEKTN